MRHHLGPPPPQADWQFSSSFDGHVPLSPDVVSPPTLTGPKPVGCPREPHGALRQPHKSISTGTLRERAPGVQMLYQQKEGKGGERKRRRKGRPQNSCLPTSTHHTDSRPARSHLECLLLGYHGLLNQRVSLVDGVLSQWSSGVQQQSTWLLGTVLASSPASPFLVVPAWLLLEHDLSFCFLAGT